MIVTFATNCYYESLYINGKLVLQGINLYICDVLEQVEKHQDGTTIIYENPEIDEDWLLDRGKKGLPKNLKDIKLEV